MLVVWPGKRMRRIIQHMRRGGGAERGLLVAAICCAGLAVACGLALGQSEAAEAPNPRTNSGVELCEAIAYVREVATILAIVFGGIWTWMVFVRTRQRFPKVNLELSAAHWMISDSEVLLRIKVEVRNDGAVRLPIGQARMWVQQIEPLDSSTLNGVRALPELVSDAEETRAEGEWPFIAARELQYRSAQKEVEPGETDEINFDFIVDSGIDTALLYVYIRNLKKRRSISAGRREMGWEKSLIYSISSTGGQ